MSLAPTEQRIYDRFIVIYGEWFPADRFLTDIARERHAKNTFPGLVADYCRRLDAAARAGGCAADLAAALREITHVATDLPHARRLDRDRMRQIARDALTAYDRAVSGQTAEKEKA